MKIEIANGQFEHVNLKNRTEEEKLFLKEVLGVASIVTYPNVCQDEADGGNMALNYILNKMKSNKEDKESGEFTMNHLVSELTKVFLKECKKEDPNISDLLKISEFLEDKIDM